MARKLTIQFDHAVYDTFNYQKGARLSVDSGQLSDLLIAGANALDRNPGFFFKMISGQFVVGFVRMREDHQGQKRGMIYFDLFATPVEKVEDVSILAVIENLQQEQVSTFNGNPKNKVSFRLQSRDTDAGSVRPTGTGQLVSTTSSYRDDVEFIGEFWERYRRSSTQVQLPIKHVDELFGAIDGLIAEISFAKRSDDIQINNEYFDIVDGVPESTQLASEELLQEVRRLRNQNNISVDTLPDYSDKFESEREKIKSRFQNRNLSNVVKDRMDVSSNRARNKAGDFPEHGSKLVDKMVDRLVSPAPEQNSEQTDTSRSLYAYFSIILTGILTVSLFRVLVDGGLVLSDSLVGLLDSILLSGLGVVGIATLALWLERFDYDTNFSWKPFGMDLLLVIAVTIGVELLLSIGFLMIGTQVGAIDIGVNTLNPTVLLASVFGLVSGYSVLEFLHYNRDRGSSPGFETSFIQDPETINLDNEVVEAVDQEIQQEVATMNEWIDQQLIPDLQEQLHQAAKQEGKQAAVDLVNDLQELKESTAYQESDLEDLNQDSN